MRSRWHFPMVPFIRSFVIALIVFYGVTPSQAATKSNITAAGEVASLPFTEDFETGALLASYWQVSGTYNYRTQVTSSYSPHSGSYHLTLDDSSNGGSFSRNELTLTVNLASYRNVVLTFWAKEFDDESHGPPSSPFVGGSDFDGVAISADGGNWYEVAGLRNLDTSYQQITVKLDSAVASLELVYNDSFKIRFNQYDNYAIPLDGFTIDDIEITGQLAEDLQITPPDGLRSRGYEQGHFSPSSMSYTLSNVGGAALGWTAAATAGWLDIDPGSGSLAPGGSSTVAVSLHTDVDTLSPGTYHEMLSFTNLDSGFVQTRDVLLEVMPRPGEIEIVDSIPPVADLNVPFGDVFIGLSSTAQVTLKNLDPQFDLVVSDISLIRSTVQPGQLSVMLPAAGGAAGTGDCYIGAEFVNPELPMTELKIWPGYRALDSAVDVLLLASGSEPTILRTAIGAFGDINLVDYFNCATSVPSLSYLAGYDVVVIMSNSTMADAVQTGDVLADYVDGCGRVIQAVATFSTGGGWELGGRFVTGDYEPFVHGPKEQFGHSLGSFDATDPIMQGVSSLTDGLPSAVNPKPGAELVASWDNGTVLVATRDKQVVGINIFAFDNGSYGGDVHLLFHNAIVWLVGSCDGFELMNVPQLPLTIQPLDSCVIDVNFTLTKAQDYRARFLVCSNDADEPNVVLAVTGTGVPEYLEIAPEGPFEFSGHPGGPFVPSNTSYELTNIGPVGADWTVIAPDWLDVSATGGYLKAGYSTTVAFTPNASANTKSEGVYTGKLVFTDITTSVVQQREVTLNVYTAPKVWLNPDSFDVTLGWGRSETEHLTIGNTGDEVLDFTLTSRQTGFTPPVTGQTAIRKLTAEQFDSYGIAGHDFNTPADVPFAVGELLVRFADPNDAGRLSLAKKEAIVSKLANASIGREYELVDGLCLIELPDGMTVEEALIEFNQDRSVLYAQPNYEFYADQLLPNDPMFGELWGLHNTGQTGGTIDADIDAPEAWERNTGSEDVVVAVIDTGIDYTHPDLAANMWVNEPELDGTAGVDDDGNGYIDDIYGYDFRNEDGDPMDDHYHGTHCAGTIGAVGDNGIGVTGLCWNVRIMALKFLSSSGSGWGSDAIECIEYSIRMGANLLSNSWGGRGYDQALKDAIDAAGAAGMLFVASAGNDSSDNDGYPHYPSGFDSECIIAVMSTDKNDNRSFFSNYGATSVDIGAPGSEIMSCAPGGGYQYLNGTSMAAPHVSGACALVWSMGPGLPAAEVKDIVLRTVDQTLPGLCVSQGRLNLYNAVLETRAPWLQFVPESGQVACGGSTDVSLVFDGNMPPGTYHGEIDLGCNDPHIPQFSIPVSMKVEAPDYFTELFDPNGNDLSNKTLVFVPDGSVSYYRLCVSDANGFGVDPAGGTVLSLGDDDYEPIGLGDNRVNFYGVEYDTVYVGSNGYISFVSGDTCYIEGLADQFDLPRISMLFDDLDASAGGEISVKQLDDRVVVTYENVPEYSLGNSNSFQAELLFDGKIRLTFLEVAAEDGLAGLSDGSGVSAYFVASNLSEYAQCDLISDLNNDLAVDLLDYGLFAGCWQNQHPGDVIETVRDEFGTISFSGNDGTVAWPGDWQEQGESDGPETGLLQVSRVRGGCLSIGDRKTAGYDSVNLSRSANLAGAIEAVLSYDYSCSRIRDGSGDVRVMISADGGVSWDTLATYTADSGSGSASLDISSWICSDTRIRFETSSQLKMQLYIDDVQIEYDQGGGIDPCCRGCDFDCDIRIDFADLAVFLQQWLM